MTTRAGESLNRRGVTSRFYNSNVFTLSVQLGGWGGGLIPVFGSRYLSSFWSGPSPGEEDFLVEHLHQLHRKPKLLDTSSLVETSIDNLIPMFRINFVMAFYMPCPNLNHRYIQMEPKLHTCIQLTTRIITEVMNGG